MARNDPQVNIRLPVDLKDRLEQAAARAQRSFKGEIVARLERTFRDDDAQDDLANRRAAVAELADRIREADETGSSAPRERGAPLVYPTREPGADLVRNVVMALDQLNAAVGALAAPATPPAGLTMRDIDEVAAEVSEMAAAIQRERPARKRQTVKAKHE